MFKSITVLTLNESVNFTLNESVILLGQIISKAPKLSSIDISCQEKNRIEIIDPAESSQDIRLNATIGA